MSSRAFRIHQREKNGDISLNVNLAKEIKELTQIPIHFNRALCLSLVPSVSDQINVSDLCQAWQKL